MLVVNGKVIAKKSSMSNSLFIARKLDIKPKMKKIDLNKVVMREEGNFKPIPLRLRTSQMRYWRGAYLQLSRRPT